MAAKPDLQPGIPVEIVSVTAAIMEKLHELYAENGVFCPVNLLFTAYDDAQQSHDLRFVFDRNRGSGEYVLVRHE